MAFFVAYYQKEKKTSTFAGRRALKLSKSINKLKGKKGKN
jgi:hypothetical protein